VKVFRDFAEKTAISSAVRGAPNPRWGSPPCAHAHGQQSRHPGGATRRAPAAKWNDSCRERRFSAQ
jgi:hypothetical protein